MTSSSERVEEELNRIRETLRHRHGPLDEQLRATRGDGRNAIDRASSRARINAHWGITSEIPVFGRLLVLARRTMRIGLRWYINPIVEQQNTFNDAVVRALYELQAEIDNLRAADEKDRQEDHE